MNYTDELVTWLKVYIKRFTFLRWVDKRMVNQCVTDSPNSTPQVLNLESFLLPDRLS